MRHGSSKCAVALCAGAALVVASCTPAENARVGDAAGAVDGVPELTASGAALSRGGDGHIWIELSGPREQAGRIWLVVDRDFEPVGRVRIPLELDYVAPFGREIRGTARLEDGVAVIAGFSLDSPGS